MSERTVRLSAKTAQALEHLQRELEVATPEEAIVWGISLARKALAERSRPHRSET